MRYLRIGGVFLIAFLIQPSLLNVINIEPDDSVCAYLNVGDLSDTEYINNNYIVFVSFVSFVSFVKLFVNIYFVCKMFVKIRSRSPFSSFLPCQISSLSHPFYKRHRLYKFVQNSRYLYYLYCLYHLYFCKLFVKFQAHLFVFL